jgi:DNA-3-methyladenine glycosylase
VKVTPLPRTFYERPVLQVARALLGCLLVRVAPNGELRIGRIVETEAYAGHLDPASHSYRGRTERNKTMFGARGHAYVYFTYGNHFCVNVVAGPPSLAGAVLIRALEPVHGVEPMRLARAERIKAVVLRDRVVSGAADRELANGPGKLTAALAIDRALDGIDVTQRGVLYVGAGASVRHAIWTPRIGLGSNPAAPWLWRCCDPSSEHASRIPRAWPRSSTPRPSLAAVKKLECERAAARHQPPSAARS